MAEKYCDASFLDISGRIPHRGTNWRSVKCTGATLISEFIDAKNSYHTESVIYENSLGGRIAIYASMVDFEPLGIFGNHMRLKWLHGLLQWLS